MRALLIAAIALVAGCSTEEPPTLVDNEAAAAAGCKYVEGAACGDPSAPTSLHGTCECAPAAVGLPSDRVAVCCDRGRIRLSVCVDGIHIGAMCRPPDAGVADDTGAADTSLDTDGADVAPVDGDSAG